MQSTTDAQTTAAIMSMIGVFMLVYLVFFIAIVAAHIIPLWKVLKRMGFAPGWSFLFIAPFGVLIGLYLIAFSKWPNETPAMAVSPPPAS